MNKISKSKGMRSPFGDVSNVSNAGVKKVGSKEKGKLSIGTFNITGVKGKFSVNNLNYIVTMLTEGPDVLALQEVSTSDKENYDQDLKIALKARKLRYRWEYHTEFPFGSGKTGKSYQIFYNKETVLGISNVRYLKYKKEVQGTSLSSRGRVRREKEQFSLEKLEAERPPLSLDLNMKSKDIYNMVTWHAPTGIIKSGSSYVMALLAHGDISKNQLQAPEVPTFLAIDANAVESDMGDLYEEFPEKVHQNLDMISATKGWEAVKCIDENVLGQSKSNGHNGMIVTFKKR